MKLLKQFLTAVAPLAVLAGTSACSALGHECTQTSSKRLQRTAGLPCFSLSEAQAFLDREAGNRDTVVRLEGREERGEQRVCWYRVPESSRVWPCEESRSDIRAKAQREGHYIGLNTLICDAEGPLIGEWQSSPAQGDCETPGDWVTRSTTDPSVGQDIYPRMVECTYTTEFQSTCGADLPVPSP